MNGISHQSWIRYLIAWRVVAVFIFAIVLCGCSDDSDSQAPSAEVGFRFGIHYDEDGSEDFVALTSDAGVISLARSQLAQPDSERALHINGPIERGNADHNLGWGWHFVPDVWTLAGSSAEVCDGLPQGVEDDIDYWVDTVQSFCPWDSYVKVEIGHPQEE